jgi:hypothetical protein
MVPFNDFQVMDRQDGFVFSQQIANIVDIAGDVVYVLLKAASFHQVIQPFANARAEEPRNMLLRLYIMRQVLDNSPKQFLNAMISRKWLSKKENSFDHWEKK